MRNVLSVFISAVAVAASGSSGTDASTADAIATGASETVVAISSQPIPWIALDATRVIMLTNDLPISTVVRLARNP